MSRTFRHIPETAISGISLRSLVSIGAAAYWILDNQRHPNHPAS